MRQGVADEGEAADDEKGAEKAAGNAEEHGSCEGVADGGIAEREEAKRLVANGVSGEFTDFCGFGSGGEEDGEDDEEGEGEESGGLAWFHGMGAPC